MSATALPAESDRSDFRTVMLGGTKLGLVTAVAVVAFLAVSRQVTAHVPQRALETLIVLAAGAAVTVSWVERAQSMYAVESIASHPVEITVDGDTFSFTD